MGHVLRLLSGENCVVTRQIEDYRSKIMTYCGSCLDGGSESTRSNTISSLELSGEVALVKKTKISGHLSGRHSRSE